MLLKKIIIIIFSIFFVGCKRGGSIKLTIINNTKDTIQYDIPSNIYISNGYENVQSIFLNSKIDTLKSIELYDQINGTVTLINQKPVIRLASLRSGESIKYSLRKHDGITNFAHVYFFYTPQITNLNKEISFEEYVTEMKKSGFLVSGKIDDKQNIFININLDNSLKLNELAEYDFSKFLRDGV